MRDVCISERNVRFEVAELIKFTFRRKVKESINRRGEK